MNNHQVGKPASSFPEFEHQTAPPVSNVTKAITTIFLLTLGYYVLTLLDAWPSTIKRSLYEIVIYLIPSHAIYAVQGAMTRLGRLPDDAPLFKRSDFGKPKAKAEAVQHILGHSPLPSALRRAKSFSGLESVLPHSKDPGPPGLGNWDNSCYQNSVLQGLASLPAFQHYIEESLNICDSLNLPAATHRALRLFLHQLSDLNARKSTLWTPTVLKSMDSWQQQDAQEYFSRILEAVEKEDTKAAQILKRRGRIGLEGLASMSDEEDSASLLQQVSLDDSASSRAKEKTPERSIYSPNTKRRAAPDQKALLTTLRPPTDGLLAQALECQTCGFSEGYSLTPFNCLTLNLGLNGNIYLEDLLDEYTEPEVVEGVECTECTKALADGGDDSSDGTGQQAQPSPSKRAKLKPVLRTKAKQITVGRLPKNLVIHINRSIFDEYGNQRKNSSIIRFPSRFEFLNDWCAPLSREEDKIQAYYELKCSVTHYGRHENGHYVAFGKRGKDWYCFNDEIVTRMQEEDVLGRGNIFMLFYEAVAPPPIVEPQPTPEIKVEDRSAVLQPVQKVAVKGESTTSSSSEASEAEPVIAAEAAPAKPVPVMRTASGQLKSVDTNALASSSPAVSAL